MQRAAKSNILFTCTLPFFTLLDSATLGYFGSAPLYIFKTNLLESAELPFVYSIADYMTMQDYVTVQGYHFESFNMMPVIMLKVNNHALISLYQLYSHTYWIPGKENRF